MAFPFSAIADDMDALKDRASGGEAPALFELAERHEQGVGVPQDLGRAAALYQQAADRGHGAAQYRLGLAKSMGLGLAADLVDAYGWLTLAASAENPSSDPAAVDLAAGMLDALAGEIDAAGREQALTFAKEFEPSTGPLDEADVELLRPLLPEPTPSLPSNHLALNADTPPARADKPCGEREHKTAEGEARLVGFTAEGDAGTTSGADGAGAIDWVQVKPVICDTLRLLHASDLMDETIDLILRNQNDVMTDVFREGDVLVIDAAAGDMARQVFIDYLIHDGTVVHLFPSDSTSDNRLPSSARMRIGGPDAGANEWQVTPPFGNDLVVLYTIDQPLHSAKRQDVEAAETYLPYLKERLTVLSADAAIGIDYHVVQTAAR